MKTLRKTAIVFILTCHCVFAQGQQNNDNPQPTWQWRCDSGDSFLNFNPAIIVDSSHTLVFDSLPYAKDYTTVVVYKPVVEAEAMVWRLDYDTVAMRGLTTEHTLSGHVAIRYTETTTDIPVINTLRQSWPATLQSEHFQNGEPDSTSPYVRLMLGGDTLPGRIKVAEVLYYNRRLGNAMLRRVQSALALRYGITLGPVDYISGKGERIWKYSCDSTCYHHRVTGVGADTVYGVCQKRSRSEMEGSMVTITTDTLSPDSFLFFGDDDAPLSIETVNDDFYGEAYELLSRRWRIHATGTGANLFNLSFDTQELPFPVDSLVLLVDDYIYRPNVVTADAVEFGDVFFPTDTCSFTLARGAALWRASQTLGAQMSNTGGECGSTERMSGNTSMSLYPNPTTERFLLEVSGTRWVKVTVHNLQGKVMATYHDNGKDTYLFEGALPSGNVYYATVITEDGSQTIKIVVK